MLNSTLRMACDTVLRPFRRAHGGRSERTPGTLRPHGVSSPGSRHRPWSTLNPWLLAAVLAATPAGFVPDAPSACAGGVEATQVTKAQRDAIRACRALSVVVTATGDGGPRLVAYEESVRRGLMAAGFPLARDLAAADATLAITLKTTALSAEYGGGLLNLRRWTLYTGARVEGEMTFTAPGVEPLRLAIAGEEPTRSTVSLRLRWGDELVGSEYREKYGAPFEDAASGSRTGTHLAMLAALRHELPYEPIAEVCRRTSGRMRGEVLEALGSVADSRVVGVLMDALDTDDSEGAVRGLRAISGDYAVNELASALSRPSTAARALAVEALGRIGGPAAIRALAQAIRDPKIYPDVAGAVDRLGWSALPALEAAAAEPDVGTQCSSALLLARMAAADPGRPELLERVLPSLQSEHPMVQASLADALGRTPVARVVESLLPLLEARDPFVRDRALASLRSIAGDKGKSPEAWTRWWARSGRNWPQALPPPADPRDAYAPIFPLGSRDLAKARRSAADRVVAASLVRTGVGWLVAHQRADGGWSARANEPRAPGDIGVTALALLALLGSPVDSDHGVAGAAAAGAVRHLRAAQDSRGAIQGGDTVPRDYRAFNHAFATLALVEAYAVLGDLEARASAQKALTFAADARNPYFGWRYGVKPGDNDTAVTSCMILSLRAASVVNRNTTEAGLPAPFEIDSDAFEGARDWIDKMTDPDTGTTGYDIRGASVGRYQRYADLTPSPGLPDATTAMGAFVRQCVPRAQADARVNAQGVAICLKSSPEWKPGTERVDFVYWLFGSLAFSRLPDALEAKWDHSLVTALAAGQSKDGENAGSWDPVDAWGSAGGRVYSTAMSVRALQAPVLEGPPDLRRAQAMLTRTLEDERAPTEERIQAFRHLGVIDARGAEEHAIGLLRSGTTPFRLAALEFLARYAGGLAEIGTTDSGAAADRERTPSMMEEAARRLEDPDVDVRRAAVTAVRRMSEFVEGGAVRLQVALKDADESVRRLAIRALGELGPRAAAAAPSLAELARVDSAAMLIAVLESLPRIAPDGVPTLDTTEFGLGSADPWVRAQAAHALADFGASIELRTTLLQRALAAGDPRVAALALRGLGRIGGDAAIELASTHLNDPRPAVVREAADILCRVGTPTAGTHLLRALRSTSLATRAEAARGLARFGPMGRAGLPNLEKLLAPLGDRPAAEAAVAQGWALLAYARQGGAAELLLPAAKALLAGGDESARILAAEAVGELAGGGHGAAAELGSCARTGSAAAKLAAVLALGRLGADGAAAEKDLAQLALEASDAFLKAAAQHALTLIRGRK